MRVLAPFSIERGGVRADREHDFSSFSDRRFPSQLPRYIFRSFRHESHGLERRDRSHEDHRGDEIYRVEVHAKQTVVHQICKQ